MTGLDDLLDAERERTRTTPVDPPSFEQLRARGLRRRRRNRALATAGTCLAVVGAVAATQLASNPTDRLDWVAPAPTTAPPDPTSTPAAPSTTAPSTPAGTTDGTGNGTGTRLLDVVVAPEDPRARVSVRERCSVEDDDGLCEERSWTLAVTGDGFATHAVVAGSGESAPVLTPLTTDAFHVAWDDGSQVVLRTDGATVPVQLAGSPAPLGDGEALVLDPETLGHLALDPETGTAHPVPVPDEARGLVVQGDGTMLATLHRDGTSLAAWSSDGGETWQEEVLSSDPSALLVALPSARAGTLAVLEGADGATLFPLLRVHRSLDGGGSWESYDLRSDPQAYAGGGGVLPDGRLLVDVDGWSDDRIGSPGDGTRGLHESAGRDWSRLQPVHGGEAPAAARMLASGRQVRATATPSGLVLTAVTPADGTAAVSSDGGRTWADLRTR